MNDVWNRILNKEEYAKYVDISARIRYLSKEEIYSALERYLEDTNISLDILRNNVKLSENEHMNIISHVVKNYSANLYSYDCEFSEKEIYYIIKELLENDKLNDIDIFTSIKDNSKVINKNKELKDKIDGVRIMNKLRSN